MNIEIIRQMQELRLDGMIHEFEQHCTTQESLGLSFNTRLLGLLNAEATYKSNKRLQMLLKKARLKELASVHSIDYSGGRKLSRDVMESLITLDWIRHHRNICFTGASGVGKTWLACALGHEACLQGFPVLFKKVRILLEELQAAKMTGTFHRLMTQLSRYPLLILDDWAVEPFSSQQQSDLFELIDERHLSCSTIITAQMPVISWHDAFPNKNIADSMMDRLINTSYQIELSGDSMRRRKKVNHSK